MEEKDIKTTNLDEVVKDAKMPRFLYDEVRLDGTSNLKKNASQNHKNHKSI